MKIIEVQEPEYSQQRLEEFEQRFGITSSEFYSLYQRGINALGDEMEGSLWAFEYEICVRAQELLLNFPEDGQADAQYSNRHSASAA